MNKKISDKDKKDWENFITGKEKLLNKDSNFKEKNIEEVRTVDLHGFTLDKANSFIEEFIIKSYKKKTKKIVVITGKGLRSKTHNDPYVSRDFSILKNSVPNYIKTNKNLTKIINTIEEADANDGGDGAFYIHLKSFKE